MQRLLVLLLGACLTLTMFTHNPASANVSQNPSLYDAFVESRRLTPKDRISSDDFVQYLHNRGVEGLVRRVYYRPIQKDKHSAGSPFITINGQVFEKVHEEEFSLAQVVVGTRSYQPYNPSEVRYTYISTAVHQWNILGPADILDRILVKSMVLYAGRIHPVANFLWSLWDWFNLPETRYGFVSTASQNTFWEPYYMYEVYGGVYGWVCKVTTNMRRTNATYVQIVTDSLTGNDVIGTLHYPGIKWEYSYGWELHNQMLQEAWERYHGGWGWVSYPYYSGLLIDNGGHMLP